MRARLFKAHGLGNDYLVWMSAHPLDPPLVRALCDRHRGPGADGILEPTRSSRADHGVRIWNPDGTVAEKSGNGLRIFARWLVDHRGQGAHFTVDTGSDVVGCEVSEGTISVAMGTARFTALEPIEVEGVSIPVLAVDVGNPHCVCFREESDLDGLPWRAWGRALETHPTFPKRTNVQFVHVSARAIHLRIWERGAGETSASGSSSCAVAAAAVYTGQRPPGRLHLQMPGGTLQVDVSPDYALTLTGPVTPVGVFELDARWHL